MEAVTLLVEEFRALVGAPPYGFEWLEYLVVCVFVFFLVSVAFSVISSVLHIFGGD